MAFINTWQFNLLFYIIFSVIFSQFYKLSVKKLVKDGAGTVILQTVGGLSALLLAPFFPFKFPTDWRIYLFLTMACVFYAINDRLQTTIRKNLEISVYSIINQLSSVFLIIIGLVFFKETLVLGKILGAGLILLANIFLSYRPGKFKVNKYILLNIFASISIAIALSIDIDISQHFNLPFYIMFTLIVPTLMIKTTEKISTKEVLTEFNRGNKKYFFLTGISWALLIVFMLRAYRFASVTLITPLSATTVLINVLVATIFLGERKNILRKVIAAIITILGICLTVFSI